jgi:hypothetical protein
LHNYVNGCHADSPYLLFALRNPLQRIRSAYKYDRPDDPDDEAYHHGQKLLYFDCPFPTLNALAEEGLSDTGTASHLCKARAKRAIQGEEWFGYHLFFNHRHYARESSLMDKGKKLLVIRTEHIADDWNSAEVVLGGQSGNVSFPRLNKAESTSPEDYFLSEHARELCNEIQLYKELLHRALNLKPAQVEQSLAELESSCPLETSRNNLCRVVSSMAGYNKSKKGVSWAGRPIDIW